MHCTVLDKFQNLGIIRGFCTDNAALLLSSSGAIYSVGKADLLAPTESPKLIRGLSGTLVLLTTSFISAFI